MKRLFVILIFISLYIVSVKAQKEERAFIRKANKEFNDSSYNQAEIFYRKALDVNPNSVEANFNLGNLFFHKEKYDDALKMYGKALESYKLNNNGEGEKRLISKIYYNSGVALHKQNKLEDAIKAYKEALKNNPQDNDAKYNLTLALNELKKQQSSNGGGSSDKKDDEQENDKQKEENQDKNSSSNNNENKEKENKEKNRNDQSQNSSNAQKSQEISDETAENLLKSVLQDEKGVQEKVNRAINAENSNDLDKNW